MTKEHFEFSFKNPLPHNTKKKVRNSFFKAYYYGGKDLRIFPIYIDSRWHLKIMPFPELDIYLPSSFDIQADKIDDILPLVGNGLKNSWDIFYNHATFDDILNFVRTIPFVFREHVAKKVSDILQSNDDKRLLKLIGEYPLLLDDLEIRQRFIKILASANSLNREVSERAKYLLSTYLIPKHKGGRRPLPDDINYDLAKEIIVCLSKHLSEKIPFEIYDDDSYEDFKKWAKDNEQRFIALSRNDIEELQLKKRVQSFATRLLESYLKAHLKTVKKKIN